MQKNAVKYGLLLTGTIIAWVVVMHFTGLYSPNRRGTTIVDYLYLLIPAFGIYFGIQEKRDRYLHGRLTMREGLKEGMLISLVYGILSAFVFMLYYNLINPEIVEVAKAAYGMTEFTTQQVIFADMLVQIIFSLLGGLALSAVITAYLIRVEKPAPIPPEDRA